MLRSAQKLFAAAALAVPLLVGAAPAPAADLFGYGYPPAWASPCGQWPTDLSETWHNRPYENFGCATQNNLAVMVEDPSDLYYPRALTARDSQRRDEIFDRYRAGENTSAKTGTDDAATASNIGR